MFTIVDRESAHITISEAFLRVWIAEVANVETMEDMICAYRIFFTSNLAAATSLNIAERDLFDAYYWEALSLAERRAIQRRVISNLSTMITT